MQVNPGPPHRWGRRPCLPSLNILTLVLQALLGNVLCAPALLGPLYFFRATFHDARPAVCSSERFSLWPSCPAYANCLSASPTRTYGSPICLRCYPPGSCSPTAVPHRGLGPRPGARQPGPGPSPSELLPITCSRYHPPCPIRLIPPGLPPLL